MRDLEMKIINEIKDYAKEHKQTEDEVLTSVVSSLINYSAMSSIEPIILKNKEWVYEINRQNIQ